jgi:isopenicillin N synthase-like dioxygenase
MVAADRLLGVPTIDISALVAKSQPDAAALEKVVSEIGRACEDWGFFYIVNHGIDPEFIAKTSKLGVDFFLQPKVIKDKVARNEVRIRNVEL